MTRVLHVHSGNLFGGVEVAIETLAAARDLEPDLRQEFALCFEGEIGRRLKACGATVHDLGAVRFSRPIGVWRARRRIARLAASRGVDVLLAHSTWSHVLASPAAAGAGRPLVTWLHDVPDGRHWLQRLAFRRRPALLLGNSAHTRDAASRAWPGVPSAVLHPPRFLAPPSTPDVRRRVRRELDAPDGATVIVLVGRLEPLKGHPVLIEALAALRSRDDWRCWIVGGAQRPSEEAYVSTLAASVERHGLGGRVRFLGQRTDVPDLLAAADVMCQPNVGPEGFGLVFVEALAAGLPVVTSDLGAAREVLDGCCGRLVAAGDPPAVAAALAELLDDPDLRARLGAAGRTRAADLCDPAGQLARLHEALRRVVH